MSRRTVVLLALALVAIAAGVAFWFRPPVTPVAVLEPGQVADDYPFFPFQTSSEDLSRLLNQSHRPRRDVAGGDDARRVCVVTIGGEGVLDPEANRPTLELSNGQRVAPVGNCVRVDYLPDKVTAVGSMAASTFRLPAGVAPRRFRAGDIDLRCEPVTPEAFVRHCEHLRSRPGGQPASPPAPAGPPPASGPAR